MPQFVLSDANWKRFLKDAARLRRQGAAIPPAIVADMIRARAEGMLCAGEEASLAAAVQAARAQLGSVNPDAALTTTDAAVLSLYTEPLC